MSSKLFTTLFLIYTAVVKTSAEPMSGLDFDKYQGTWYLIEFANVLGNGNDTLPCLQESYTRSAGNNPYIADMHWSGGAGEQKQELDGIVAFSNPNGAGTWDMFLDGARLETQILFTDYTTWAVEFTSGLYDNVEFRRLMIRSRTTSLDPTVLATIHTFISGMSEYHFYKFDSVDHSVC